MNKIYLIPALLIFFTTNVFSQKEANNWIFGFNNKVDFSTDPPTASFLDGFEFFSERNTVSQSDEDGNLLFYSEGFNVFNRNEQIMPNGFGLISDFGSSHPVYVIPKPNSSGKYYLITSVLFNGEGMFWSEIDMNLDNGMGDITSNKNIPLGTNSIGKITAVLHNNLEDIWIISHEWNSNNFAVWLATEDGIGNPTISAVGSFINDSNFEAAFGEMKISPDGSKVAVAYQGLNRVELFDFDRTTGQLSNVKALTNFNFPYGLEFSPNGRFLYVSQIGSFDLSGIQQFDLTAGTADAIQNSAQVIGGDFESEVGSMQLGPDGKIYMVNFVFNDVLGVINKPDVLGEDCDFDEFGLQLQSEVIFGLPDFFHVYLQKPFFTYSGFCLGGMTDFTINQFEFSIDSVSWDFGDVASGVNNFSNEINASHQFTSSGTYDVKLTLYSNGQVLLSNNIVHIAPTEINLGPDQTICASEPFTISAFTPNAEYIWSNNANTSSIVPEEPGTFWVEVSVDTCGVLTDTITIEHLPAPNVELGNSMQGLCKGAPELLDVTDATIGTSYDWSTGSSEPTQLIEFGGFYGVTVSYPNGCTDSDEVNFLFDEVEVNPNQADLKCYGDSNGVALVFPLLGSLPFTYEWENGDTLYTRNKLSGGTYTITVTDQLGCTVVNEFNIHEPSELKLDITINDDDPNTSAPDGAVFLNPSGGIPPYQIKWDPFGVLSDPVFELWAGTYNITVTDENDCEVITEVMVDGPPVGNEDSLLGNIQVYPNPTSDILVVTLPIEIEDGLQFSMTNTLGQTISDLSMEKNNEIFRIDVKGFANGIYFLKIKKEEKERIWKVNVIK